MNRAPHTIKRTKRAHGVRKQDATAMEQFKDEQKRNPAKLAGHPEYVRVACTCSAKPRPHFHSEEDLRKWHQDAGSR